MIMVVVAVVMVIITTTTVTRMVMIMLTVEMRITELCATGAAMSAVAAEMFQSLWL